MDAFRKEKDTGNKYLFLRLDPRIRKDDSSL